MKNNKKISILLMLILVLLVTASCDKAGKTDPDNTTTSGKTPETGDEENSLEKSLAILKEAGVSEELIATILEREIDIANFDQDVLLQYPKQPMIPGLVTGELKKQGDIATLKSATLKINGTMDLTELYAATELEELQLSGYGGSLETGQCIIPDLSRLTNLKAIAIYTSWLPSIKKLNLPVGLERLTLNGSGITNTDFVSRLTNITELGISSFALETVTNLDSLKSLKKLSISNENILFKFDEPSLKALQSLTFTDLEIVGYDTSNLTTEVLSKIDADTLTLDSPNFVDLNWLSELPKHKVLAVGGDYLIDISGLYNSKTHHTALLNAPNVNFDTLTDGIPTLIYIGIPNNLKSLENLKVDYARFTNSSDATIAALAKNTNVNKIQYHGYEPLNFRPLDNNKNIEKLLLNPESVDFPKLPVIVPIIVLGAGEEFKKSIPEQFKTRITFSQ